MRESSYCLQRILAIAILSVCPSVTQMDQSKMVQARIMKSLPSAAWKTTGTVKLFHKFERVTPNEGAKMRGMGLLITNRKSYTGFQLPPRSMTLNDLEHQNRVFNGFFGDFGL